MIELQKLKIRLQYKVDTSSTMSITFLIHGVQRRMILVDNFVVFLRLLFFALLLLYET